METNWDEILQGYVGVGGMLPCKLWRPTRNRCKMMAKTLFVTKTTHCFTHFPGRASSFSKFYRMTYRFRDIGVQCQLILGTAQNFAIFQLLLQSWLVRY